MFESRRYLVGHVPTDAISGFPILHNRMLRHHLKTGDFIFPDDLIRESPQVPWPLIDSGLGFRLQPGYRYVSFRFDEARMKEISAEFNLHYPHVDIVTVPAKADKVPSQVLLENLTVVCRDEVSHVTVAIKDQDAITIAAMRKTRTLDLMLRRQD
jgi:hypothetical protein